ncbi:sulfurtransferase TusA family protein [Permianibacter sp. IMCC34836]|uniref:sulfurtransferase TusA family protein n=1 Tax=Permianibacter fluminis TaxID=2738515 RepID=UPI00155705D9|nr:sulfurtransferase TusA family protein [Permianibacter fluminis]NQD38329.1 sulfurtransferase TusA family protein [Permianibacter fluminis]
MSEVSNPQKFPVARVLDARGLRCPLPLLRAKQALIALSVGEVLEVLATDPGALRDIPAWCRLSGQQLLAQSEEAETLRFLIQRAL